MNFRKNAPDIPNAQNQIQLFPLLLSNFIGTLGFSIVLPFLVFLVKDFGGVIAFSLSIISSLLATKIRTFEFRPLPAQARDYIIDPGKDRYDELLRTSIAQMTDAFNTNNGINTTKANRIKWNDIDPLID